LRSSVGTPPFEEEEQEGEEKEGEEAGGEEGKEEESAFRSRFFIFDARGSCVLPSSIESSSVLSMSERGTLSYVPPSS
jgi:hypothetical protein